MNRVDQFNEKEQIIVRFDDNVVSENSEYLDILKSLENEFKLPLCGLKNLNGARG